MFGKYHKEQCLFQAISLSQSWRGLYLEHIGTWARGSIQQCFEPDKIVLQVENENAQAFMGKMLLSVSIYDQADYHSRHRQLVISEKMRGKKVLYVGMGTIGSKMAIEPAKHGVEQFFIDPQQIEIENPYRMAFTLPPELLVGQNKALATAEAISMISHDAVSHAYDFDVCLEPNRLKQIIKSNKPDIIILSTDTRDSIREVNGIARQFNIPVLHVVLSDGAESGQIYFMSSKQDEPCLVCIMQDAENTGLRDSRRQYAEEESRAQISVPSLSVDTSIIASIAAKILMAYLAGESIKNYFTSMGNKGQVMWVSTTPDTWILEDAFQKLTAIVEKNPKCPGCWKPEMEAIVAKHKQRKEGAA